MLELSLHILDLAQNSLRADADTVSISVDIDTKSDSLCITVSDNGKGMSDIQLKNVFDPFYTTKKDKKTGFGLAFLKSAAQLADGDCTVISKKDIGTSVKAYFSLSHPNRMPLGDMSKTFICLVTIYPDREFKYELCCDGVSFTSDTAEIRKIIKDIPINTPEVLDFIKKTIHENTEKAVGNIPI